MSRSAFDEEILRALAAIGHAPGDEVVDAVLDPGGALAKLVASSTLGEASLLRVFAVLGEAHDGFGPSPQEPSWLHVDHGGGAVFVVLRGEAATRGRLTSVWLETKTTPCCEASGCTAQRELTTVGVELEVDGDKTARRFVVAEPRSLAGQLDPRGPAIAAALAKCVGVPAPVAVEAAAGVEAGGEAGVGVGAGALARFALQSEGDRIVLRDFASVGPREPRRGIG